MLPNYLHIGVAKGASTWLWSIFKEHPEIYAPEKPDNVNFFTVHYHRGLKWYEDTYFSAVKGEKAVGEFSNSYIVFTPAVERIAEHLPRVKLTMTLRNPIQRAYLGWAQIHLKKRYGLDPERGIAIPLERALDVHGHQWFRHWIEIGLYATHLKRIYRHFPKEQVLVTLYDDLASDPKAYLRRMYDFLGVDPDFETTLMRDDINPDVPGHDPAAAMTPGLRRELQEVYKPEFDELETMIGRDLTAWRNY